MQGARSPAWLCAQQPAFRTALTVLGRAALPKHTPAPAARVIPRGGDLRNVTQPWAALCFAPKILQGHYTSYLSGIHLLKPLEVTLSPPEPARRQNLLWRKTGRDRAAWRSQCHSERSTRVWEGSLMLGLGGTPQVPSTYVHPNTDAKPLRTFR